MADPKGFLKVDGARAARPSPRAVRIMDWKEVYEPGRLGGAAPPGRPLHGLRHPVLPPGLPARQPDPRVERPHVARRGPLGDRAPARDEQLPRVHRAPVPRAVRELVRAGHQPARRHDQAGRSLDHRRGVRERLGRARTRPERLTGKTVAVVGSGPAGLAAAQQLTRAGHTVAVFERDDRIGGLLRYGIPDFKMEKQHLETRLAQMQAEGTRFRAGVEIGVDITWDDLRVALRRRRRRDGRDRAARSAHSRARPRRRALRDGVPRASPTRSARATRCPNQITAEGKHVVVIGGGDTGADCIGTAHRQGALSVTNLAIGKQPPERATRAPAVADGADALRGLERARRGRRARLPRVDRRVPRERRRRGARDPRRRDRVSSTAAACPSAGTEREIPADLVLLAMGFTGPERRLLERQLGPQFDEQRQRRSRRRLPDDRARRLRRRRCRPRPVAHRLGDRRGPRCGRRRRRVP